LSTNISQKQEQLKKFINKQRLKKNLIFQVWLKEFKFEQLLPHMQKIKGGKYQSETRGAKATTLMKEQGATTSQVQKRDT